MHNCILAAMLTNGCAGTDGTRNIRSALKTPTPRFCVLNLATGQRSNHFPYGWIFGEVQDGFLANDSRL